METNILKTNQLISTHLQSVADNELQKIFDHHFSAPGKQIRPHVVLMLTECLGGKSELAVPWAAVCELFHNGTLIHDDFQDGDVIRRDKMAVWKMFGSTQAINAGDMLLLSPINLLNELKVEDSIKWKLSQIYSKCTSKVVYGQALEQSLINLLGRPELKKTYLDCIGGKTAELFKMCALGVAEILNLKENEQKELAQVWYKLGIIFQLQDDLLDVYGDKGRGEVGCDIKEGKVSSLIVELLEKKPEIAEEIKILLLLPRDKTSDSNVDLLISLFEESKAKDSVIAEIKKLKAEVFNTNIVLKNEKHKNFVEEILDKILNPISNILN